MPRDSNGVASTDPVYLAVTGETIRAVQHNTPIEDIISMLTGSLARNGTGGMQANLAMGGFKITGLANATLSTDAVAYGQLSIAGITSGTINGATIGATTPAAGTFTSLTVNKSGSTESIIINSPASYYNYLKWSRGGTSRYWLGLNNTDDTFIFWSDIAATSVFGVGLTGIISFTQTPTAPTAAGSDSSTKLATTAQVHAAINNDFNISGSAPKYACRAWVNFNGTGTVAIRSSGNVSSITDDGTGLYTVNFATALADANYSVNVSAVAYASATTNQPKVNINGTAASGASIMTSSALQIQYASDSTRYDASLICVSVFR